MLTKAIIEKVANELNWEVNWENKSVLFSKSSPCGQDFNVELDYKNLGEIEDKLREYYDSYDPNYEAYLWLDDNGHGKNGAPYEMIDVYNDMLACESMMLELYQSLHVFE